VATGLASPVLFVATFMSGLLLGLTERVLIGAVLAWLTAVAIACYRGSLSTTDDGHQGQHR
jgi:hypothetical protein